MIGSDSLPQHVAIIMDGNGRWAEKRRRDRIFGHIKGARVAKKIVEASTQLKLKALTLYAFSEENWGRPETEVNFLFRLLARYIIKERKTLMANNIRFRCIGNINKLPEPVKSEVEKSVAVTSDNTGMQLTFALSYGGRQEITQAVRSIAQLVEAGKLKASEITEDILSASLQTAELPDPDLIIRTSGEFRLSNFLPWQSIYTELYFTETLWPDFTVKDYKEALTTFRSRDRRFGRVSLVAPATPREQLSHT